MFKHRNAGLLAAALLLAAGFVAGSLTTGGADAVMMAVPAAHAQSLPAMDPADVAEMTMPAVVNINTDKVVERQSHPFMDDPSFRRSFDMPDNDGGSRVERSLGSGVVISADGYIVTNNHVVENAENIRVSFNDRETYDAEIVGTDPQTDVALIKIDADKDLPFLSFGDSEALRIGERIMAVGNPFGVGQTVTMGIVSAKGRSIGLMDYEDHIQTDAAINPGNSGGAMVNMRGEVVGINSAILSRSGGSQGIGFAIPANMVQRILTALRTDGEVKRAWLGVQVQQVNQGIADYYGLDKPYGVLVARVNDGTPAEDAGLEEGDLILSVDGKRIDTVAQLRNTVSLLPVGHKAKLAIQRGDKEMVKTVKLGELPTDTEVASRNTSESTADDGIDGVTVRALNPQLRAHNNVPEDVEGLMIVDVESRSNAAREGLAAGDVIVELNTEKVSTLAGYREAAGKNTDRPFLVRVYRPRSENTTFMAIPR